MTSVCIATAFTNMQLKAPAVEDKPSVVIGKTKSGRVTKSTAQAPAKKAAASKKAAPTKKTTPKKATPKKAAA